MADAYYDGMVPTQEQFKRILLPILTITGQYDGDELGAMTFYRDHMANASPETRAKHFLIIGPWDHAGTRTPTDEVGGVKFGPAAIVDLNDLHRQWYDWTMKNGAKPEFLKNQVAYYLLAPGNSGANGEWKYTDNFANLIANPKTLYLDSKNGDANGVFRAGMLVEKQPNEGADQYVNDPMDTSPGENVEGVEPKDKTAATDQSFALCIGKDRLVYHTGPLPKETPLVGCPKVSLWVSLDTPDTDLQADLYEIQPDGTSIALWNDVRRLRYRESLREAKLVKPDEIVKCNFDPGLFVARRLMKGSRLRLVVYSPNSIFWQKNYNSGGVVVDETADNARGSDWTWRARYAALNGDDVPRMERPGGMLDWSRAKIDNHRSELAEFESRWKKIDSNGWPVPKQVDYSLIGSAWSRVRWELDINPRWKRDPNFYIEQTLTALVEALTVPAPYDES